MIHREAFFRDTSFANTALEILLARTPVRPETADYAEPQSKRLLVYTFIEKKVLLSIFHLPNLRTPTTLLCRQCDRCCPQASENTTVIPVGLLRMSFCAGL